MTRYFYHMSPLGRLLLAEEGGALTGLWLEGQKYYPQSACPQEDGDEPELIAAVRSWLGAYFSGERPEPGLLPLAAEGTEFQKLIWRLLISIPYGETVSYSRLAGMAARELGREKMSARAVGSAVGKNPIAIIVPCHRVLGKDGSLTGYAGGTERKLWLLRHEGAAK